MDWRSARLLNEAHGETKARCVNVDFPSWMADAMDKEAGSICIIRQAFTNVIVAERLDNPGRA